MIVTATINGEQQELLADERPIGREMALIRHLLQRQSVPEPGDRPDQCAREPQGEYEAFSLEGADKDQDDEQADPDLL